MNYSNVPTSSTKTSSIRDCGGTLSSILEQSREANTQAKVNKFQFLLEATRVSAVPQQVS